MTQALSAASAGIDCNALGAIFVVDAARYLLPATLAYVLLWTAFEGWSAKRRRVQARSITASMTM